MHLRLETRQLIYLFLHVQFCFASNDELIYSKSQSAFFEHKGKAKCLNTLMFFKPQPQL